MQDEGLQPPVRVEIKEFPFYRKDGKGRQKNLFIQYGDSKPNASMKFIIERKENKEKSLLEFAAEVVVMSVESPEEFKKMDLPKELVEGILKQKWGEFQWMKAF